MGKATTLEKISNFFFFTGSVLKNLPLIIISPWFTLTYLLSFFIGYTLLLVDTSFDLDHQKLRKHWHGIAEIENQTIFAAVLGIIATLITLLAVFSPVLVIPGAWIFFISNAVRANKEYCLLKNHQKNDLEYNHEYQKSFVNFTFTTTIMSLVTALSITFIFIFPPLAPVIIVSVICSNLILGGFAVQYWLEFNRHEHQKETQALANSYQQLFKKLVTTCSLNTSNDLILGSNDPSTSLDLLVHRHRDRRTINETEQLTYQCSTLFKNEKENTVKKVTAPPDPIEKSTATGTISP